MLIMHIGFLACFHAISLERSRFSKIATLTEAVGIAHKPPRSLLSENSRRHTDTQNDYYNPRCACAPRVNKHEHR